MATIKLKFKREHGFSYNVQTDNPGLAVFKGIDRDDPAAQRGSDIINGVEVMRVPKPESILLYTTKWQRVGVFANEDDSVELALHLKDEDPIQDGREIEVALPD